MNKKIFVVVLIVCLTFGMAFAAKKADIKVGAQMGYGSMAVKTTHDSNNYLNIKNGGFYFAATGEYGLSDAISAKAAVGINTMGKANVAGKIASFSYSYDATKASPVEFSIYAGAEYTYEINKDFAVSGGAGVDMLIGKVSSADDANTNAAIGIALEAVGSYKVNKQISAIFGMNFGVHFINTDKDVDDAYSSIGDNNSISNTSFKIFAGATYAL